MNPIILKGQVVFDMDIGEYVTFIRWAEYHGTALVFNPRCGERYTTAVRGLNAKEIGNYAGKERE